MTIISCKSCGESFEITGDTIPKNSTCVFCGKPILPIQAGDLGAVELMHARVKGDSEVTRLISDLKSLHISSLVPFQTWLEDKPWDLLWVRWFAFFALYPLVLANYWKSQVDLSDAAWAFGIYFATIWGLIIFLCIKPGNLAKGIVLRVTAFTSVGGIALVLIMQKAPVIKDLYVAAGSANILGRALGFVLGVGLLEEAAKALPLYWLFIHKKNPTQPRESAFLGSMSGLAFGVSEAVSYSILYAYGRELRIFGDGQYIVLQFLRLITIPLLHALWSGIVGYFVGLASLVPTKCSALLVVGLTLAAILHGSYNTFSDDWRGLLICVVTLIIFVGYSRTSEQIVKHLQTAPART